MNSILLYSCPVDTYGGVKVPTPKGAIFIRADVVDNYTWAFRKKLAANPLYGETFVGRIEAPGTDYEPLSGEALREDIVQKMAEAVTVVPETEANREIRKAMTPERITFDTSDPYYEEQTRILGTALEAGVNDSYGAFKASCFELGVTGDPCPDKESALKNLTDKCNALLASPDKHP